MAPAVMNEQQQVPQSQILDDASEAAIGMNKISGGQSHYVRGPNGGLNDARTNSGGKRFAANSEANDSIDPARRDNWLPGDEQEEE